MIEWTKNSIRTATERPYNYPGKGESIGSPFFVFKRVFLEGGLQVGLQSGVTLSRNWGYTFRVFRGCDSGGVKYRFFNIDPQFWHFTIKKKPAICKFTPY